MTHELQKRNPGTVDFTERGLAPKDIDGVMRIANMVVRAGIAPRTLNTPEKVCMALAHGAEIGFTPMQSLQSLAVINGKVSVYGDALPALAMGSGLVTDFAEGIRGEGEEMEAWCRVARKGVKGIKEMTFSVEDAKVARVWGKQGPWTQYPKRMLQMRARSFALRDMFADVLGGISVAEEGEDVVMMATVDGVATRVDRVHSQVPIADSIADPIGRKLGVDDNGADPVTHAQFGGQQGTPTTYEDAPAQMGDVPPVEAQEAMDEAEAVANMGDVTGLSDEVSASDDIGERSASDDTSAPESQGAVTSEPEEVSGDPLLDAPMGRGKYPQMSWFAAAKKDAKWMARYIANNSKIESEFRETAKRALAATGSGNLVKAEEHWTKTDEGQAKYAALNEAFEALEVSEADTEGFIKTVLKRDELDPLSGAELFAQMTSEELDKLCEHLIAEVKRLTDKPDESDQPEKAAPRPATEATA